MSGANLLTLSRLLLAPLCLWAIVHQRHEAALAIFALAVATDFADGHLARRSDQLSPRGALFDHGTDALFVTACTAALAWRGEVPAALPPLILCAFAQYALDSRAFAGEPLRASSLGRWNGIAYFVIAGTPLVRDSLGLGWPEGWLVLGLGWALVVTTLLSMLDRARHYARRSS